MNPLDPMDVIDYIPCGHKRDDGVITEADTCRKYVLPKLYAAGWSDDQINEV